MHWLKRILALALLIGFFPVGFGVAAAPAAEAAKAGAAAGLAKEEGVKEHGLPSAAVPLFKVGPLPVTNSMVVTWVVALGLIIFARMAMRNVQAVPGAWQNF